VLSPQHGEDIVHVQSDPYVDWNQDKHTNENELTGSTLASTSPLIGVLYNFLVCPAESGKCTYYRCTFSGFPSALRVSRPNSTSAFSSTDIFSKANLAAALRC
jgi:hypothetical protein